MSDGATNICFLSLERARQEGYVAGRRGLSEDANPYESGSDQARAWKFGLINGRNKPLRLLDGKRPCD
jgi:ribosome modulation factor